MKIKENLRKTKGITLVALVVTIIVLIILAGVSISLVLGENGIITKSKYAKQETLNSQVEEQGYLNEAVEYIEALGGNKTEDSGDTVNWDAILEEANTNPDSYIHPESFKQEEGFIGIGTNGEPVNMDYWNPTNLNNGTWLLGNNNDSYGANNAYAGEYTGGKIQGEVPQYIYNEDTNKFEPVVKMCATFSFSTLEEAPKLPNTVTEIPNLFACCYSLTEVSEIPYGVTDIGRAFWECNSLTKAPEIPSTVTDMSEAFAGSGLIESPKIPNSVTNMENTFNGCIDLVKVPEIPSSVMNMRATFAICRNLTGTIIINANPIDYDYCFSATEKAIVLTASKTQTPTATIETLNNLKGTTEKGNVSIAQ